MSIQLKVPNIGESVQTATIGTWLKKEGEPVQADEPVVEVESEKATVAVPAPAAGVLRKVLRQSGETVAIGEVIAELDEGGAAQAAGASPFGSGPVPGGTVPAARGDGAPAPAPAPAPVAPAPARAAAPAPAPAAPPPAAPAPAAGGFRASPSARRRMAELGVTAGQVEAIAAGGQIRRDDVARALEARPAAPAPAPAAPVVAGPRERVVAMTPLRRTVARRLVEAQHTAALLTTFNEVDMSRVLALREQHGEAFLKKHGVKLGFMSFFVKASIEALRAYPGVNGEIRGDSIVYKDHYDVGVAVGGGKGLVVPVIRDADALSFAEVEATIGELAKKAKENRITMEDLAGGTFTISNGGIYGSMLSTPIINPPQSGILGLHKIQKRAVVDADDQVVVRPMMYLALSYDHRLVDGREAVSFLVKVKECIEDPERMLLEV
ncbi:2-oxoglutarate dehydrogenase, E2 subunit, dihydrolipoamide succinyltransferase [Anaeromyxobacter sp. K]|uniref:2-oxoglutarate dehydrogenase complex dihydrolipoyllysine-residue succinyltransferase n=1 Tax=Anaeromyxobacter sp. (strain K) TaxID=447217 RepID=UPI00017BE241|nr:2-oxoglutarate dehydrogenase complex dihydrolipoyllysine-residue succinyltransferase [Anaeromyxobacter sp. K]ACG72066.1 2-oxoglutarate dehydrogenase, E2 subunit, dihydrolipoamide succinyltransferase [Anaeromyxobacter sp. K]